MNARARVHLLRKEKPLPLPPAKPPARPPAPTGIRAPGGAGTSTGGMVCLGPRR